MPDKALEEVQAELATVEAQVASLQQQAGFEDTTPSQEVVVTPPEIAGTQSDPTYISPTDTWESVAARLGTTLEALFAANAGLGGCTTMQTTPVGFFVTRP